MGVAINIKDETSKGEVVFQGVIQFPVESITVRELIEARVQQEVEGYNTTTNGEFVGLVQPSESEVMLNGYRMKQGKLVDVSKQKTIAIQAFESNKYFLLVNDEQKTDP